MPVAELRASPVSALIREHRLIVVLRGVSPDGGLADLVRGLADAGVRAFEVTMDGTDAPAAIDCCRQTLAVIKDPWVVGAGTVRTPAQLELARRAGADFVVSPVLDPQVMAAAIAAGLPVIPGAYTPTEADAAWRAGATFVKLFPASSLGAPHVRELRGPLPEIEVIPTGGIDAGNAAEFLAAGAVAVGIGSAIVRADDAARRGIVDAVRRAPRLT